MGMESNIQGSALDIQAKESARQTRDVARMRIVKLKVINITVGITSVGAPMPSPSRVAQRSTTRGKIEQIYGKGQRERRRHDES